MIDYLLSRSNFKKHRIPLVMVLTTLPGLLLIHWLWLAPLIQDKRMLTEQVRQQHKLIGKYQEKLTQAQHIKRDLEKQEIELKELQKRLFQDHDPYQLAASLGDLLSAKEGPKIDIKTYQVLDTKQYGLYQEVHLRFNLMTNIDGLHAFLKRLENFPTAIWVQELNIQKIQRRSGPDLVINVILAALIEKGQKP